MRFRRSCFFSLLECESVELCDLLVILLCLGLFQHGLERGQGDLDLGIVWFGGFDRLGVGVRFVSPRGLGCVPRADLDQLVFGILRNLEELFNRFHKPSRGNVDLGIVIKHS